MCRNQASLKLRLPIHRVARGWRSGQSFCFIIPSFGGNRNTGNARASPVPWARDVAKAVVLKHLSIDASVLALFGIVADGWGVDFHLFLFVHPRSSICRDKRVNGFSQPRKMEERLDLSVHIKGSLTAVRVGIERRQNRQGCAMWSKVAMQRAVVENALVERKKHDCGSFNRHSHCSKSVKVICRSRSKS